jgi:adenine phosphoribosyltransferase
MDLLPHVRTIADFPKPGIQFRDLTPLLGDARALAETVKRLAAPFARERVTKVVGIEARGFLFGAPVAVELSAGFVPVRKAGRLPHTRIGERYSLEYGAAELEIHEDAVAKTDRVLLVDDVLATGGTCAATVSLVRRLGATIVGTAFVIELLSLKGRARLPGIRIESLLTIA